MLVLLWLLVLVLFLAAVAGVVLAAVTVVRKFTRLIDEARGLMPDHTAAVGSWAAQRRVERTHIR